MRIIRRLEEIRRLTRRAKQQGKRVGFVPTMGALHEGHLSLIRKAHRDNALVVVSIFVNPTQFDQASDLRSYPRTLQRDARLAAKAGADLLFVPSTQQMYSAGFQTTVEISNLSRPWEGKFRPGHFLGVTTVVSKLFNLVQPNIACFGQKDAQQARIVRQLIRDMDFDIRLKVLPTVREPDGLAMSSRNQRLSTEARRSSRVLFQALQEATRLIQWGHRRENEIVRRMRQIIRSVPGTRIDYATVVDPETLERMTHVRRPALILLAVWVGKIRLIDCCEV